jgi:hypothetical protein
MKYNIDKSTKNKRVLSSIAALECTIRAFSKIYNEENKKEVCGFLEIRYKM